MYKIHKKCPVAAIEMINKASINYYLCIGCASCITICPVNVIANCWDASDFHEKIAEYAFATTKDKKIYTLHTPSI